MPQRILSVAVSLVLAGCMTILLSSCFSSRASHDNFKEIYGSKVGKRIDDPNLVIGNYPKRLVGSRELAGGAVETEYEMQNPGGRCLIFFQSDPRTSIIESWRFEGSEEACSVPP